MPNSVNGKGKAPRGTPFLGSIYALSYWGSLDQPAADDVLQRFRNSAARCSALGKSEVRTMVDMVLFDRMEHAEKTMDNFSLRGEEEYSCSVPARGPKYSIEGKIDYIIGHGPQYPRLDSVFLAIEVMVPPAFEEALPQLVCYLGMYRLVTW
jgi:hypothetical protein